MRKIGLFLLPGGRIDRAQLKAVLDRLSVPSVRLLCLDPDLLAAFPFVEGARREEAFWEEADVIVALGGDGTILAAAPMAARHEKPVFGVNFGHVGFLTAAQPGETGKLDALLGDRALSSRRMMLSLRINGEERDLALNEIMLAPKNRGKLLACSLAVNGNRLAAFRADALLFHTPTGSTSYAFSAGGAVCSENLECVGVKAVAPYMRRGGHHMLFAPDAVFTPLDPTCPGCPPEAVADGRQAIPLAPDDRVEIRRAERDLVLLFTEPHDNHVIFCEKQREAGREQP